METYAMERDDVMMSLDWNENFTMTTESYAVYNSSLGWENDTTTPPEAGADDFPHHYVYLPIQILISCAAVIANMLTVMALNQVSNRFQPHLILVVNLTISDMLFGLRNIIIRGIMLAWHWHPSLKLWFKDICVHGLVRVVGSAIYTCTYINLIAMAFDLYFAIMKPFQYQKLMTRKRSFILTICLWILSLFLALTNYIVAFFHWLAKHKDHSFCYIREKYQVYDVYVYLVVVYGGIIAMTYLYIRVFLEVRRCARYTPGMPVNKQQKVKRNKAKIVTSLIVLITFLVAWLPNGIFTTLFFIMPTSVAGPTIALVGNYCATLPMLNCICDPAIYAIRLDKVRIGFRKLCGGTRNPYGRAMSVDYASEMTEQTNMSYNGGTGNSQRGLLSQNSVSNGSRDCKPSTGGDSI